MPSFGRAVATRLRPWHKWDSGTNYNIYSSEGAAAWVPWMTSSAVGLRTCFKFFRKYHLPTQRWWESPSILLTSCFCAPPARDSFCWLQLRALGGTSTDFHPLKKGPLCLSEPTLIWGSPRGLPWNPLFHLLFMPFSEMLHYPYPSCCMLSLNYNYLFLPPLLGLRSL